MTPRFASLPLAVVALASACSPSFEAALPEVEITQRDLKVPAMLATTAGEIVAVSATFTLSPSDAAWAKRINSDVRIHQVRIISGSSLPNLDFIECARITVSSDRQPGDAIDIMNCERGTDTPSGSVIQVVSQAPNDITIPWTADQTSFGLQVAGRLPTEDWTVDVTLKLSGAIVYKY